MKKKRDQEKLLESFKQFETFCRCMIDAYVLLCRDGKIIKCNQLFSILVGKSQKNMVKKNYFSEVLNIFSGESKITLNELLENETPTRIDEIRGETESKNDLNLIMGVYPFFDEDECLGLFLLLRDVTAETNLQGKYKVKATQSITDKLTGLYNRTYFDAYLPKLVKTTEVEERKQDLSILLFDIDHFKPVNDTYGHQAGDYILEKIAKDFQDSMRSADVLCRYGGEEFLGILPNTNIEGAEKAAEKFRRLIEKKNYVFEKTKIDITISIGIAQIIIGKENASEAIARADAALYFSKHHGRNCVSLHQGEKKMILAKKT